VGLAGLRAGEGCHTQPTESDIEGTRANMLEKVLEAEKFPFALIGVSGANTRRGDVTLNVAITLHGSTRTLQVPAEIEADAEKMRSEEHTSELQSRFDLV